LSEQSKQCSEIVFKRLKSCFIIVKQIMKEYSFLMTAILVE